MELVKLVNAIAPVSNGDTARAVKEGRYNDAVRPVEECPEGAEELRGIHAALPLVGKHMLKHAHGNVIQDNGGMCDG